VTTANRGAAHPGAMAAARSPRGRQWTMVTRNRDDVIELTRRAFATNRPHHGVLVVGRRTPNTDPEGIAHALAAWARRYDGHDPGVGFIDFL